MIKSNARALPSVLTIALVMASLLFSGCSATENQSGPQELIEKKSTSSGFSVDTPEDELLRDGKRLYEAGLYSVAKEAFESLRDGYPNSPYAEFADVKVGDCLFESGDYPAAKQSFDDFVKNRSTSSQAAYAMFRSGRAAEEQFTGVGRDPSPIKQAKEVFMRVMKTYPTSPYAGEARERIRKIDVKLASYETTIATFYRRTEKEAAAEKREAATAQYSSPKAASITTAPELVTVRRNSETEPQTTTPLVTGSVTKTQTLRVLCSLEDRRAFIFLPSNTQANPSPETVRNGEEIKITVAGLNATVSQEDCFGAGDLTLHGDTVTLRGVGEAVVMSLSNPPRLLIQPR